MGQYGVESGGFRSGTSPVIDVAPRLTFLVLDVQWLVSVHNAASAVADLLVTGVLIYTLRQNKRRSMKRYVPGVCASVLITLNGLICRTNDMINDLILYAVSTGTSPLQFPPHIAQSSKLSIRSSHWVRPPLNVIHGPVSRC